MYELDEPVEWEPGMCTIFARYSEEDHDEIPQPHPKDMNPKEQWKEWINAGIGRTYFTLLFKVGIIHWGELIEACKQNGLDEVPENIDMVINGDMNIVALVLGGNPEKYIYDNFMESDYNDTK